MSMDVKELLKEVLQLPPKDRAALVSEVLQSLDDEDEDDDEVEAAWAAELQRRVHEDDQIEHTTVQQLERDLLERVKKKPRED